MSPQESPGFSRGEHVNDIWISVDVETTGAFPGIGELCTIGAVAYHGDTLEELSQLYIRLEPKSSFDKLLVPRGFTRAQAFDAWEWAGEPLTWNLAAAIVFIVGGLYLVIYLGRRKQRRLLASLETSRQ